MTNPYRLLPKVDELLELEEIVALIEEHTRTVVLESIRIRLDRIRDRIRMGITEDELRMEVEGIVPGIRESVREFIKPSLCKVVNATGVVLHTNMGRAPLHPSALREVSVVAEGYSNLEYDLESGTRGSRYKHLEEILKRVTGAESAMVVNNNAAAVMLILSTVAKGKEVITSRGELIEIGGAFRIPEVCEQSGAKLIEVGTTNKTHLADYERAIDENTAAILKVHTSNYRVLGFTEGVSAQELKPLTTEREILILEDLGSGVLIDLSRYGLDYEPTVRESIESGVDVVCFSGDKLLGGPQAGIIAGKKEWLDRIKKNPLTRALRVDKFTIAALEATLRLYLDEETAVREIPILNMLTQSASELKEKAESFSERLRSESGDLWQIEIVEPESEVGGGSLPLTKLPSFGIALMRNGFTANALEERFRAYKTPIIGRIIKDKYVMDMRTIDPSELDIIAHCMREIEE